MRNKAVGKVGGPDPVFPGQFDLELEARRARARLLPSSMTFGVLSGGIIAFGFRQGPVAIAAAATVLGVFAFTFVEYAVHRWILHRRFPDGPGVRGVLHRAFDHLHVGHHARPWDSNHNGGTLNDTFVPVMLVFSLLWLATPFAAGPVFWAAVVASYVVEEWIHHALHYCSFKNQWFLALRRHHFLHHAAAGTESNYGLTSGLWDAVIRTAYRRDLAIQNPRTGGES